ncbi:MAG: glycosyltransferase [Clostridia bacterium]|nr:glycosyltransferase [Clostridia bacterium]MBR4033293.1 glycosyltransferase [Clostridia bacterium]
MKILMLADSLDTGGAETHISTLATELHGRSPRAFFGASRGGENVPFSTNISEKPLEIILASAGGKIAQSLVDQGFKHILLPTPSRSLLCLFKTFRIIERERPSIVHAHTRRTALAAFLPCKIFGIPLAVTFHARFSMSFPKRLLTVAGDVSAAVSEDIREHIERELKIPKNRIKITKNGVKIPEKTQISSKNHHKIVFVSRLDADCSLGADLLCSITPRLAQKYPDIEIILVGGGEEYPRIAQKCREINQKLNRELIISVGAQTNVEKYLRGASLFVGVSRAALEAMAQGLPVILLGNEGFLGLLDEENLPLAERTNFTCRGFGREVDADVLFAEIQAFFSLDDAEKTRISTLCRDTVKKDYSAHKMAQDTLLTYAPLFSALPQKNLDS